MLSLGAAESLEPVWGKSSMYQTPGSISQVEPDAAQRWQEEAKGLLKCAG